VPTDHVVQAVQRVWPRAVTLPPGCGGSTIAAPRAGLRRDEHGGDDDRVEHPAEADGRCAAAA
jgi:hypothetical protein